MVLKVGNEATCRRCEPTCQYHEADLDPRDLWPWPTRPLTFLDMIYCPVNFCTVTDRHKAMHNSPLCISTYMWAQKLGNPGKLGKFWSQLNCNHRSVQFARPTSGTNQFETRTNPFCPQQVPRTCLVISQLPLDPQRSMTYRFVSTFHDKPSE